MSLDPGFKKRWIEALRSGDYEQGPGRLCSIGADGIARYCCLGVAAELKYGEDAWVDGVHDGVHDEVLRIEGVGWAYFWPEGLGDSPGEPKATKLSSMNDDGDSFAEIADYIEANL